MRGKPNEISRLTKANEALVQSLKDIVAATGDVTVTEATLLANIALIARQGIKAAQS